MVPRRALVLGSFWWFVFGLALLLDVGVPGITAWAQNNAGPPAAQWVQLTGGAQADFGNRMVLDAAGNVYTIVLFSGTASFGPTTLTSRGAADIALAKYSPGGTLRWVQQLGGAGRDYCLGLCLDAAGNPYVAGGFEDVTTIGPATTLTSAGDADAFVAKYAADGTLQWARRGGGPGFDLFNGVAVSHSGAVVCVGEFTRTATFGTTSLTNPGQSGAPMLLRLDASGQWQGAHTGTTSGLNRAFVRSVQMDAMGNVFVLGSFFGQLTLGATPLSMPTGFENMFVAKMGAAGSWEWAQTAPVTVGNSYGAAMALALGEAGNLYCAGTFTGTMTFGGTALTANNPGSDLFVAKLNATGDWQWAQRGGGPAADVAYGLKWSAATQALYLAGTFTGSATFGPLSVVSPYSNYGDLLVARLDAAGTWQWLLQGGGADLDYGTNLDVDAAGNVFVSGSTLSPTLTLGNTRLTSHGDRDALLLRLGNYTLATRSAISAALAVYPNPATGRATLQLAADVRAAGQVEILDATGRLVRQQPVAAGQPRPEISLRGLPGGVYTLRLVQAGRSAVGRLVVQ